MKTNLTRWEHLPDFPLYNDQLCSIAKAELEIFLNPNDATITMAMVNNYVKNKIIPKPEKKKYTKQHLASVIVITLLKQIFTIDEIKKGISLMLAIYDYEKSYDMFCDLIEKDVSTVKEEKSIHNTDINAYLSCATKSIANNIYVKNYLSTKEVK